LLDKGNLQAAARSPALIAVSSVRLSVSPPR
jgi:hypothetical protein